MFRYSSGSPSLWSALFLASATLHFSRTSSRSGIELSASDSDPEIAQGSVEYCAASCGAPASTSLEWSAHCCSEHPSAARSDVSVAVDLVTVDVWAAVDRVAMDANLVMFC